MPPAGLQVVQARLAPDMQQVSEHAFWPRKPQDSRSAAPQRPYPPRPLLTQPRPFYGHRQGQITRAASHRADEVENVVLVPCRDQLPKQAIMLACISPHSLRLGRVVPVLPVGPARPLQTFGSARPRAWPAVHAATPVRHRSTSAWPAITAPRATPRRSISQRQALAENARMRFVFHFEVLPPRRRDLPPGTGLCGARVNKPPVA
jgi:hypothetical protein